MNALPYEQAKREIIYKENVKLKKTFPKRTADELLNFGIINLDKPKGPKSIHVVNKIRSILEQPKCGHAGTLDPAVTGVLPIGLGKAVKVLPVLSLAGKVYEGLMHLHGDVSKEQLQGAVKQFTGKIKQTPPSKSAVARREREREVYWFEIKKITGRDVEFETGVEHGTYIRTLCIQIGEHLGVGAHMQQLRRLQAGPLKIAGAVTVEEVKKNYFRYLKTRDNKNSPRVFELQSRVKARDNAMRDHNEKLIREIILQPEECVGHLPTIWVDFGVIERLKHGSPVFVPGVMAFTSDLQKGSTTAIFDLENNLLGFGLAELNADDLKNANKGLAVKTDVVLI